MTQPDNVDSERQLPLLPCAAFERASATYEPVTSVPRTAPLSVCSPAALLNVQRRFTRPFPSVTARAGVTAPAFTVKLSGESATGFPYMSVTIATSLRASPDA